MDNEINIKIGAEDNFSNTFKKVSESLNGLAVSQKNVQTSTEATTNSFSSALTGLKALSNTAESFDRIQSTIINTQLRLENAYQRVLNAQDRVQSATSDLQKAMSLYGKDSLEAADAQDKLERAQRQLTITENNQQRVQNQLWGTYLSIISSTIQLIGTLPQLIKLYQSTAAAIRTMNVAQAASTALMNPAVALGAIAAAGMAVYAINAIQGANAEYQLGDSLDSTNPKLAEQAAALDKSKKAFSDFQDVVYAIAKAPLEGEMDASEKIGSQTKKVADINKKIADIDKNTIYNAEDEKQRKILITQQETEEAKLNLLKSQYDNEYKIQHDALISQGDLRIAQEAASQLGITNEYVKGFADRMTILHDWTVAAIAELKRVENAAKRVPGGGTGTSMGTINGQEVFMDTSNTGTKIDTTNTGLEPHGSLKDAWSKVLTKVIKEPAYNSSKNNNTITRVGDAIIRPNGQIINTNPKDTIVALKDIDSSFSTAGKGQSIVINITGDNYGTNPDEIARVLYSKLRRRIAI